jgi:hypothetical protein
MATDWVVYSKPCLARTDTVVDYLGRYSHRIALSTAVCWTSTGRRCS